MRTRISEAAACVVTGLIAAAGAAVGFAPAASAATTPPCPVAGAYSANVIAASSGVPTAVTTQGGTATIRISLAVKLEVTGFEPGFSMDSNAEFAMPAPTAPAISLSLDGGAWQPETVHYDRSGMDGGINGYPWAVEMLPAVPGLVAGSTHTLAARITFAPSMKSGAYHTWFFFSGGLPCNGSSSVSTVQQQATMQYAPAAGAPKASELAAQSVTGGSSSTAAAQSAASAAGSAAAPLSAAGSASGSSTASSGSDNLAAGAAADDSFAASASPTGDARMVASAAGSSGSSVTWLAVMAAAFLLAAGATGAAVMRRHAGDDSTGEGAGAENGDDE